MSTADGSPPGGKQGLYSGCVAPTDAIKAARIAVRGTTLERWIHSAGEWSSPPRGPSPSRVGTPIPAVVFASDARQTQMAGDRPRTCEEDLGPVAPLHRVVLPTHLEHRRHVGHHVAFGQRSKLSFGRGQGSLGRRSDLDRQRGSLGHDVHARAALADADVEGGAVPPAVQRVDRDRRMRRLEHRAPALLRLDARVGCTPGELHAHVRDALPGRDDRAVLPGGLEDEHGIRLRRSLLDERPRRG